MSRRGMSLAEVAIAILLLLVAYVALSELFSIVVAQVVTSRARLLAERLAGTALELYEARGSAAPGFASPPVADLLAVSEARTLLVGEGPDLTDLLKAARFKVAVHVDEQHGGVRGLNLVRVTVEWTEDGRTRRQTHARLFAF